MKDDDVASNDMIIISLRSYAFYYILGHVATKIIVEKFDPFPQKYFRISYLWLLLLNFSKVWAGNTSM